MSFTALHQSILTRNTQHQIQLDEEDDDEDMEMRLREEYHSDEIWEEIDVDSLDERLDIIEVYDEDGELVGTYTGAEFDKLKRNK